MTMASSFCGVQRSAQKAALESGFSAFAQFWMEIGFQMRRSFLCLAFGSWFTGAGK